MTGDQPFPFVFWDYLVFAGYFVALSAVGLWAGREKKRSPESYFLAGRTLPWYVVGSSFIASNISSEHFIGMIGAAYVYGIAVAMAEWGNISVFSLLIWIFIPFLLASRVFTIPEFLEKRFNRTVRQFFALVTIVSNVVAFLAAVLYGGALMLEKLFGWDLWFAIISLGVVAGTWAIYGGLRSVAWTDFVTLLVMIVGGLMVTFYGLDYLSGDSHSLTEGWRIMIDRNQAHSGVWQEAVAKNAYQIARVDEYNRLSVIQPPTHEVMPWPGLALGWISVGIWYSVINQFMIQRVLGAKNMYHARMGIVLAGYLKILMPALVVVPGLILFALQPEVMLLPWEEIRPAADRGYVTMVQAMIPVGLRGLFLAALFGAIQSTVNSVINSTATVFTWDLYRRSFRPNESDNHYVRVGVASSIIIMAISIILGRYIEEFGGSLFVYIQTLYAFFAPPFAAVFLLGLLSKRINAKGATAAVFSGFAFGIAMKLYVQLVPDHFLWVEPYAMQALINWCFCAIICVVISGLTAPPAPENVTDQLTFSWSRLNIGTELGHRWYNSVVLWWAVFVGIVVCLMVWFSGLFQ